MEKVCASDDEDTKKKLTDEMCSGVSSMLDGWKDKIPADGFLCGSKLTLGDFILGGMYTNVFCNDQLYCADQWKALLKDHEGYEAYGKRFAAEFKDYLEKRPKCAY